MFPAFNPEAAFEYAKKVSPSLPWKDSYRTTSGKKPGTVDHYIVVTSIHELMVILLTKMQKAHSLLNDLLTEKLEAMVDGEGIDYTLDSWGLRKLVNVRSMYLLPYESMSMVYGSNSLQSANSPQGLARKLTFDYLQDWRRYSEYRGRALGDISMVNRHISVRSFVLSWSIGYAPMISSKSDNVKRFAQEMSKFVFWYWFIDGGIILCDFPSKIDFYDGKIGRMGSPAIEWKDGAKVWAVDSVIGSERSTKRKLTLKVIVNERNAEMRRVMVEQYGYERFLKETGSVVASTDSYGVIWRVGDKYANDRDILEVVNSTPNPDGSEKKYYLMVARGRFSTPKSAVEASFARRMPSGIRFTYNPVAET